MSKAVTKGAHWMPRTSQFSLHGQRNGRVDILPPNAKMPTFEDLAARYQNAKKRIQAAQAAYNAAMTDLISTKGWHPKFKIWVNREPDHEYVKVPSLIANKLDVARAAKTEMCAAHARCEDYRSIFLESNNQRYERTWINTAVAMLPHDVVDKINGVVATLHSRQKQEVRA